MFRVGDKVVRHFYPNNKVYCSDGVVTEVDEQYVYCDVNVMGVTYKMVFKANGYGIDNHFEKIVKYDI